MDSCEDASNLLLWKNLLWANWSAVRMLKQNPSRNGRERLYDKATAAAESHHPSCPAVAVAKSIRKVWIVRGNAIEKDVILGREW